MVSGPRLTATLTNLSEGEYEQREEQAADDRRRDRDLLRVDGTG
jgi:hypothetical protein